MRLQLKDDLPFVAVSVTYREATLNIPNILVDTGSASTILAADVVAAIGILPESDDTLYNIRGVGGAEVVYTRRVDLIGVEGKSLPQFEIEVGGMDYGFEINGILGMDFLRRTSAILNLHTLEMRFADA